MAVSSRALANARKRVSIDSAALAGGLSGMTIWEKDLGVVTATSKEPPKNSKVDKDFAYRLECLARI